tara:strand:- start:23981 stop:25480 length:1500 start_codon:yes stop_codon:yes gene_type:complete
MKTLLFSNQGLSPSHLGIELEIIEKEIADGNDVRILYCKSNLQSCFFNASHNLLACSICEGRTRVFYDKIKFPRTNLHPLQNFDSDFIIKQLDSIEDVFAIAYKGYDIGRGIAASYISTRRNYEYQVEDQGFIEEMALMCVNVVDNLEFQLKEFQPEKVIVFNGRFAEQNAIIEVCERQKVDYYTFERSSAKGKYKFFKNMLPHSLTFRWKELDRVRLEAPNDDLITIGSKWFEDRLSGGTGVVQKYLSKQEKGLLPEDFDYEKENIAIFVASEDEHAAVKEHQSHLYKTQNIAIKKIIKHFCDQPDIHFYLRVHPSLQNIHSAQTSEIKEMNYSNLTIIQPQESIDTYQLMNACDKTLAFGSATGIEACYMGKTSILFGHAYYESINVCYWPQNYPELFDLVATKNLPSKPKENTYIFGYYQNVVGIPYSKFQEGGKNNSFYNKEPIKRLYPKTLAILSRNLKDLGQWKKMNQLIFQEPLTRKNIFKLNSHLLNEKLK